LDTKKIRIYFFGKRYQTLTFDQFKQENLENLESQMRENKNKKEKEKEKAVGLWISTKNEKKLVIDSNQDASAELTNSLDLAFSVGSPIRIPVKRKLML
jgi:hypothetical protein